MALDDEYLREVGRVFINFSKLEFNFTFFPAIKGYNFPEMIKSARALSKEKIKTDVELQKFHTLLNKIDGVVKRRNELAHSSWFTSITDDSPDVLVSHKYQNQPGKEINLNEIKKLADEIELLSGEFLKSMIFNVLAISKPTLESLNEE